jgi:hypothetical protein
MNKASSIALPTMIIDSTIFSAAKSNYDGRFLVLSTDYLLEGNASPEECSAWFSKSCPSGKILVVTRPTAGKDALLKSHSHRAGFPGLIVAADIKNVGELESLLDAPPESGLWRIVYDSQQVVEAWPEIQSDPNETPPEPFPVEAMPLPAQRFCKAVSGSLGVDIGFVGPYAISAMASALGATFQLSVKDGWKESSVLWIGVVSRPGTGKSPAMQACFAPLRSIQQSLHATYKRESARYREDMERSKKSGDFDMPVKPLRQSLICSNSTVEALIVELANSHRGLVFAADELAFWLQSLNAYKSAGGDREWYLSSWSSIPADYHRKNMQGESILVNRPCLGVIGGIQPDKLPLLSGSDDGLLSRFLLAAPSETRSKYSREGLCKDSQSEWGNFIQGLWQMPPESSTLNDMIPNTVKLSEDGHDAFELFANGVMGELAEDSMPEILRGSWAKAPTMAARLALVVHVGKLVSGEESNALELSKETMGQGIALATYFLTHLLRLVPSFDAGSTKQERMRQRILAHIKRKRTAIRLDGGNMEWTSLRHAIRRGLTDPSGHIDDRLMDQVIQGLVTTGHLRMVERVSDTGRPLKPTIQVNPRLLFGR